MRLPGCLMHEYDADVHIGLVKRSWGTLQTCRNMGES
jgi:hypothetical protein